MSAEERRGARGAVPHCINCSRQASELNGDRSKNQSQMQIPWGGIVLARICMHVYIGVSVRA